MILQTEACEKGSTRLLLSGRLSLIPRSLSHPKTRLDVPNFLTVPPYSKILVFLTHFVQGKSFCEILLHTNTAIVHPSQSKLQEGKKNPQNTSSVTQALYDGRESADAWCWDGKVSNTSSGYLGIWVSLHCQVSEDFCSSRSIWCTALP